MKKRTMRMMRHMLIGITLGFGFMISMQAEEVAFKQDFSKITSLPDAGWKRVVGQATKFRLKDGYLDMLFAQAPYKGGSISHAVPIITAGSLSFELALDTNGAKYDHFSLKVHMYNITLSFKKIGARHDLMRYYKGKWKVLAGNVPLAKKIKVKMLFDNSTKVVQYFVNDMESPAMIEEDVTLTPKDPDAPVVMIANYGLASGNLEHKMYNVQLSK
jgi:hypothetical protein